jgi:hypothetical protein
MRLTVPAGVGVEVGVASGEVEGVLGGPPDQVLTTILTGDTPPRCG